MKLPQYSLGYLFLEVFLIGACIAAGKLAIDSTTFHHRDDPDTLYEVYRVLLAISHYAPISMVVCAMCAGAAIGGLFRRMAIGAGVGLAIWVMAFGWAWAITFLLWATHKTN